MRIKIVDENNFKWNKSLFLDFDLMILSGKLSKTLEGSSGLNVKKYKVKNSLEYIINTFPELKDHIISESKVIFGLELSNKIVKSLNPSYSFELVDQEKVSSNKYSELIYNGFMPLSCFSIDSWSHDFYLHGMGARDIPSGFTNWYRDSYFSLSEEDRIVTSAIVEFTSLKHIAENSLREMFKPKKWGEFSSFFGDFKINNQKLSEIFKKHNAERFFAETLGENYAQG